MEAIVPFEHFNKRFRQDAALLKFGLGLLVVAYFSSNVLGQRADMCYTVRGQLDVLYKFQARIQDADGSFHSSRPDNYFFTAQVQATNWIITVTSPQSTNIVSQWVDICSNNLIYSITRLSDSLLNNFARNSTVPNVATALINNGPQPSSLTSLVSKSAIIWLAFASGPSIESGSGQMNPVWDAPVPHHDFPCLNIKELQVMAMVNKSDVAPWLPKNISFLFNTVTAKLPNAVNLTTNFTYTANSWTNVSGLQIPTKFQCLRYTYQPNELEIEYHGLVTGVSVEKNYKFQTPYIPGRIYVNDFSVTTNDDRVITYFATNGSFRTFTEKQKSLLAKTVLPVPVVLATGDIDPNRRKLVFGFLILTFFVPPFLIWSKQNKKIKTS